MNPAAPRASLTASSQTPYHADYGVARSFVEFAAASLEDGGWLHVVVKKPDWYVNKIRALFGGCGYWNKTGIP